MPVPTQYSETGLKFFMHAALGTIADALSWDVVGGSYDEAITDTLIAYGVTDIADATDIAKLRALAKVMVLRAAAIALQAAYDFASGDQRFNRSQMAKQVAEYALPEAERSAIQYGLPQYSVAITPIVYTEDPYRVPDAACTW